VSHSEKREGAVLLLALASIHTLVETVCMAPCRLVARWAGSTGAELRPLPGALAMHEPERWPVSNAETWWSWRDYLDRVEDLPNIATLKREADCEIARILRCAGDRWQPRKPSLIPERVGNGGGGRY
jgi:hypothetical protein